MYWREEDALYIVRDQSLITSCAVDVIQAVERTRGLPLQPRDRMALKLLTPRNSALLLRNNERHLGCRQIHFDILTDDIGLGRHRLIPSGVHVYNSQKSWWSDRYGIGRFLWNLYLGETPEEGMRRILQRLFKYEIAGGFGSRVHLEVMDGKRTIEGDIQPDLHLYIQRHLGTVKTSLRSLIKAESLFSAKDLGITAGHLSQDSLALLFGKTKRYAVTFTTQRL